MIEDLGVAPLFLEPPTSFCRGLRSSRRYFLARYSRTLAGGNEVPDIPGNQNGPAGHQSGGARSRAGFASGSRSGTPDKAAVQICANPHSDRELSHTDV